MWNEEQSAIILSSANIKQVLAAAGSGKTATMVGLLEFQEKRKEILPERTLIVTFTNKATEEFRERTKKKGLSENYQISTFHAFCYRMIVLHHPDFKSKHIQILTQMEKDDFSFQFLYKYRFEIGGIPFPILFQREGFLFKREFPEIHQTYISALDDWKFKINKFDFEDLPSIVLTGFSENAPWTQAIRNSFDSIIVDEFQDTDESQLKIIQGINPPNLTIVGDDWQAIYGFRGASPEPFLTFPKYFPDTKQFTLTTNYRSLAGIISLSAVALKKNRSRIEKVVKPHRKGTAVFDKIILDDPRGDRRNILPKLKGYFLSDNETIILVRSNFRKREWIDAGIDAEKVITIHASKGLEFGTVILDLSSGWNVPDTQDETQREEERRILYVGISRAKNRLVLIGRKKSNRKSGLEDEFFGYYRFLNAKGKPTLRQPIVW